MNSIAVQKNNTAVAMINRGDFKEAIQVLGSLLESYKPEIQTAVMNSKSSSSQESMVNQFVIKSLHENQNQQNMIDADFMHCQGIYIPARMTFENMNSSDYIKAISTVIILNLALALHLYGKMNGAKGSSLLYKALTFYEMAMSFVNSEVLSMIVLNNVALIHKANYDHQKAQRCFDMLLHLLLKPVLSSLKSDGKSDKACMLNGFFFNAFGSQRRAGLAAAAA